MRAVVRANGIYRGRRRLLGDCGLTLSCVAKDDGYVAARLPGGPSIPLKLPTDGTIDVKPLDTLTLDLPRPVIRVAVD